MKINVVGFLRATLKTRIKKAKIAHAKKAKHIALMEKELAKLNKRK